MNSESTKHGPYEYDRNSDLIGKPYELREVDVVVVYESDEPINEEWEEIAAGAIAILVVLILVFAGVVLWKVWVG